MKKAVKKLLGKMRASVKKASAPAKKVKRAKPIKTAPKKAVATPVKQVPAPAAKAARAPEKPAAQPAYQAQTVYQQNALPSAFIPEPPPQYGVTRIVLLARDPEWAFSYWEITEQSVRQAIERIGQQKWNMSTRLLRIYDVTDIVFNGTNAHRFFDVEIGPYATNWYLKMPESNRSYLVDIGVMTPDAEFIVLARSNVICMPRAGISDVLDEEWATINFEELFRLSGGLGTTKGMGSAFMVEEVSKRMVQELTMGSGAVSSFSGPKARPEKKFWLVVNTELIVYGATEPSARVTVQDIPIKLNPDGTFSLRFALPDGLQIIPVKAANAEGDDERTVTPIVKKVTE